MEKRSMALNFEIQTEQEFDPETAMLVNAAKQATDNSYAPYSGFSVGAALLLEDGSIVTGCNQENAAFPSGLCAERTALFAAGASHPDKAVRAMAIAARDSHGFTASPVTPCGACRQVIAETSSRYRRPIRLTMYGTSHSITVDNAADTLLPFRFGDLMDGQER